MVNQLEVKKSKFSLPVEVTIEEEALVIEEEVDHMEIVEEDTKTTGLMIMEIDHLDVTLEISPEDASIAVKKDT
jgi:tRNA threonylcarbamoyladenosine modification (KEOPS) complex  Pcc1 subunit